MPAQCKAPQTAPRQQEEHNEEEAHVAGAGQPVTGAYEKNRQKKINKDQKTQV